MKTEMENLSTVAYAIAEMVSVFEQLPPKSREKLYYTILTAYEEWIEKFKTDCPLMRKFNVDKQVEVQEPAAEEVPEKEEEVKEEQPKRRGRKKKDVVEEAPATAPTTAPTTAYREIEFEKGLDKGLASFSTIDDVDDDKIVNEKLGPIPLANSLPKVGEHPFFKAPAAFVWYLDMDRWPLYLANLLEAEEFYPDQLSLYDTKRLEEAKKVGVDIEFIASLVNKDSKRMVSIEDFDEKEYADDEAGIEALIELKESGFLKKFVTEIDPEKKLLKFLTRFGQNRKIADDLQTIYQEHTEHPNKYIHW